MTDRPWRWAARLPWLALLPMSAPAQTPGDSATVLTLSASASVASVPDRLTAQMHTTATAASPAAASAAVNAALDRAKRTARLFPAVRLEAGAYQVAQTAPPASRWQADQTLTIMALDGSNAALELVGQLQQQNLVTDQIGWSLAPDQEQALREQATQAALKTLMREAAQDAAALGLRVDHLRRVTIDSSAGQFRPQYRAMAASAAGPSVDQPADETISAAVSGEILLAR